MMKIRCFAVDDEPLALELIKSYIEKTPFLESAGFFGSAIEALQAMKERAPQIIFLDIQMPNLSGIQLASAIDTFKTKVIFITAFDNFALEGFKVDAIDYLLKPVSYDDFYKAAEKAYRYISASLNENESGNSGSLVVRSEYKLYKIKYEEIVYLESVKDYVVIHTLNSGKISTISTLKNIESTLPESIFIRVHRSFIVNITQVNLVERSSIIFGKISIPISENYKKDFMEKFQRNFHSPTSIS